MDKIRLQAILFDIDDTLFATTSFAGQAHYSAVQAMVDAGVKMPADELYQELREVIAEFTSNYGNHFDKLLMRIPREAYCHVNRAILVASAVAAYHDAKHASLRPYPDAVELLRWLAARSPVIRGVVTAGLEVKQAEKLVRLKILPYLTPHAIFISDQIGISKPNPKLYLHACKSLGVSPERTMYVGDNPPHDIDPPNQLGMITVHVRKGGKHVEREGKTRARYEIQDFQELIRILENDFEWPEEDSRE